ncbi:MAG: hypothetical protein Unbinned5081contig1002_13 [Prokaryotic dsDNA virus sp.]|nr:MAG: hypothetical protein Unbinned5081contig1002_13 [Prokaryotic dsDNA virus sp.]|tara:strand:+ start:3845 stop:4108 length:264 start_codon:yes stop_codon:yes gene_type:complete
MNKEEAIEVIAKNIYRNCRQQYDVALNPVTWEELKDSDLMLNNRCHKDCVQTAKAALEALVGYLPDEVDYGDSNNGDVLYNQLKGWK